MKFKKKDLDGKNLSYSDDFGGSPLTLPKSCIKCSRYEPYTGMEQKWTQVGYECVCEGPTAPDWWFSNPCDPGNRPIDPDWNTTCSGCKDPLADNYDPTAIYQITDFCIFYVINYLLDHRASYYLYSQSVSDLFLWTARHE